MNTKDQLILVVGILLIILGIKYLDNQTIVPAPQPNIPVVVPDNVVPTPLPPVIPEPVANIFYDECEKANKLSKEELSGKKPFYKNIWPNRKMCVRTKFSLQKLVDRSIHMYLTDEEYRQELNLFYVAITRMKNGKLLIGDNIKKIL